VSATRLAIVGMGKMGRAVDALAYERGWSVVARLDHEDVGETGPTRAQLAGADVAIEFSVAEAAARNVLACIEAGVPVVSGTTGWQSELERVREAARAKHGAFLWASNFSVGVNLFFAIATRAATVMRAAEGFGAAILETHHAAKKDAPSGTALTLQQKVVGALGRDVPASSVRVGHVPGTHELIFDGAFEQIRVTHEARDRRVFADGALVAARWLAGRTGVFTMNDVLGLE
jgi:4-hydroxy-tetrahydrodipicolinate reductase